MLPSQVSISSQVPLACFEFSDHERLFPKIAAFAHINIIVI